MELTVSRKWETLVHQGNIHIGYGGLKDGGGATASGRKTLLPRLIAS